jgi:hypothetical protein
MLEANLQQPNNGSSPPNPTLLDTLRDQVLAMVEQVTGSRQVILGHPLIVDFFEGDHNAAILLNQILYWSDRTDDPDGWFYKTYDQWAQELRFSAYQVARVVRGDPRVQKFKRTLWSLGLETEVRMAPNGRNATYYRLNKSAFMTAFTDWLEETYQVSFGGKPEPRHKHPPRPNPYKAYTQHFGKLTNKTQKTIWRAQHTLGEQLTLEIIARCVGRGTTWGYVVNALRTEVQRLTDAQSQPTQQPPDAPNAPQPITPAHQPVIVSDRISSDMTEAWKQFCIRLRTHMKPTTYDYHLQNNVLVDYEQHETRVYEPTHSEYTETFIIAIEDNPQALKALTYRHYKLTRRMFSDYLNREVGITFIEKSRWQRIQRE